MGISEYFPIWDRLTLQQQQKIEKYALLRKAKKGTDIQHAFSYCVGVLLIRSGQFRAYSVSDEGREITLYRLFDMDICIFTASCMIPDIQFEIIIEAEKDSEFWIIPTDIYSQIMEESAPVANYTNQLMASRFSDVMWLMDQIMWKSFDKRLAAFLLEESTIEGTDQLIITHEKIGNHLGTAREVVTRMLRYFQNEEMVKLTRGAIEIIDKKRLRELQDK